jgi:hypothetical protein
MLEAPIAKETLTAVRKAATAETLAIAGNQQQNPKQQQKENINSRPNSSVRDSWNRWKTSCRRHVNNSGWQQQ